MVNKKRYNSVEEVPVWLNSHELAIDVYKLTNKFPKNEVYGLTNQFRRCVVSVPANISEGFYRKPLRELLQFLYIARGSLGEGKYYLKLSVDLKYITTKEYSVKLKKFDTVGKQLNGWINSLRKINNKQ